MGSGYVDHLGYLVTPGHGGYIVINVPVVYTAPMGASRALISPDFRGRFALGKYTRGHTQFLLTVSAEGIITLTPAETVPLPSPLPVRKRTPRKRAPATKKAATAAADTSQKSEHR